MTKEKVPLGQVFTIGDFLKTDNKITILSSGVNILFKMNQDGDNVQFFKEIPNPSSSRQLYVAMFNYGEYNIFIPGVGEYFSFYHIPTDTYKYIKLPDEINFPHFLRFLTGILNGGCLYLFPFAPFIYVMDLSSLKKRGEIPNKTHLIPINKKFNNKSEIFWNWWNRDFEILNYKLYALIVSANIIFEFDLNSHEYNFIKLPFTPVTLAKYKGKLLLIDEKEGVLYAFDLITKKINPLYNNKNLIADGDEHFIKSIISKDYLYLWKNLSDDLIILNLKDGSAGTFFLGEPYNKKPFSSQRIPFKTDAWKKIDDKIIFHSIATNEFFCFDAGKLIWSKTAFNDENIKKINHYTSKKGENLFTESTTYTLNNFMDDVTIGYQDKITNPISQCGAKIYKTIIDILE